MTRSQTTPSRWRLVKTPPASGAWNMAVDEAILEAVGRGASPPTLRLYAWDPPCLSLGYAQSIADVDRSRLAAHGWHLVRRPTGGRAILHADELTYSVIGSHREPLLAGGVLQSYRRIAQALLDALHRLGVPAQANSQATAENPTAAAVCFEAPSNYEITVQGKKVIGSAQARRKDGILQHGTLPLRGDLTRICDVLVYPDETSRRQAGLHLLERATTLEAARRCPVAWEEAAAAFEAAFSHLLRQPLRETTLSPGEVSRAARLVEEKFAHPSWVERL